MWYITAGVTVLKDEIFFVHNLLPPIIPHDAPTRFTSSSVSIFSVNTAKAKYTSGSCSSSSSPPLLLSHLHCLFILKELLPPETLMCSPISVWQNGIFVGFSRGIFLELTGSKTRCLSTTWSFVKSSWTPIVNSIYLSTPLNTVYASITFLLLLWSYGVRFVAVVAALFAAFPVVENRPSLRIEGEDSGSGEWLLSFSLLFLSFFLILISIDLFFHGRINQ